MSSKHCAAVMDYRGYAVKELRKKESKKVKKENVSTEGFDRLY